MYPSYILTYSVGSDSARTDWSTVHGRTLRSYAGSRNRLGVCGPGFANILRRPWYYPPWMRRNFYFELTVQCVYVPLVMLLKLVFAKSNNARLPYYTLDNLVCGRCRARVFTMTSGGFIVCETCSIEFLFNALIPL